MAWVGVLREARLGAGPYEGFRDWTLALALQNYRHLKIRTGSAGTSDQALPIIGKPQCVPIVEIRPIEHQIELYR